ncbi:MAG: YwqG family protein [Ardenticatenaceae bacterium]|nr:YwqG family protein [Ardenticatenaceae bacterium]
MDAQIIEGLKNAGLERISNSVMALLEPAVEIKTRQINRLPRRFLSRLGLIDEYKLDIGASKIGGLPDLPPNVSWPDNNGMPMSFVAQFNMSSVTALDSTGLLPSTGMLYFFFLIHGEAPTGISGKVLHLEGELRRTHPPAELPKEDRFIACEVEMATRITLPPSDSDEIDVLKLTREERDRYDEVWWQIMPDGISLLGHPIPVQWGGWMQETLRTCSDDEPAAAWQLLLQVDSDRNAGMMWGDMGSIYFWIREKDLKAQNFASICVMLECS